MMSAADLASLRADGLGFLPDVCAIQQSQRIPDGAGAMVQAWVNLATNEPCRLDPLAKIKPEGSLGLNIRTAEFIITLRFTAPLGLDCRVLHTGQTYEVRGLEDDKSWPIFKRAILLRVTPAPG